MPMNTTSVDAYLLEGCGRCDRYRTPDCKVHRWTAALEQLRAIVRAAGLTEEMKWGSPCYTLGGKNVSMLVSFNESCALQFFKGAALDDPQGLLESPGPNSHAGRYLRFRSAEEVTAKRDAAAAFVAQAIALERAGVRIAAPAQREPLPEALAQRLDSDPALAQAFAALSPGRQRSHILHIQGAKQAETRQRRVDKCAPEIFAGRGFGER